MPPATANADEGGRRSAAVAAFEQLGVGKRLALLASIVLAVAAGALLLARVVERTAPATRAAGSRAVPIVSAAGLEQQSGVRVVRVAVSGDGGLLDLRYQVVDAERAHAVHDQATPPLLIDEDSGTVVDELLMGHTHSQPPKLGLTYYLIFVNPGALVRRGSLVAVQLGGARLAHVQVR
jgi:hypothetical protein